MPGVPRYDVRAGCLQGNWTEIGCKYPTWPLIAGNFRWEEFAAGPVPDVDVEEIAVNRELGTIFERLAVGQCRMQLNNARGQYTATKSLMNLVPYSDDVSSGTWWTTAQAATSLGVLVGKTGAIDADALAETNANNVHTLTAPASMAVTSGAVYCALADFFPGTRDRFILRARDASDTDTFDATFSIRSLTVSVGPAFTGSASAIGASLQQLTDGWVRCWVAGTLPEQFASMRVLLVNSAGNSSYTGTGSAWLGVRGFSLALGSAPPEEIVPTANSLAVLPRDTTVRINDVLCVKAVAGTWDASSATLTAQSVFSIFSGYVDRLDSNPSLIDLRKAQITASDVANRLRPIIATSLMANVTHRTILQAVMDEAGIDPIQYVIDQMNDLAPFAFLDQMSAGEALAQVQQSGAQVYFVDGAGRLRMKNRHWDVRSSAALGNYTGSPGFFGLSTAIEAAGVINRVEVRARPRSVFPDISTVAYLSDPVFIPAASSVQFLLDFFDPLTQETGAPAKDIQPLQRGSDYVFNQSPDGKGGDVTSQVTITTSLYATAALITASNPGPGNGYLTVCQLRAYPVTRAPDISKTITDDASIARYGERYAQFQSDLIGGAENKVKNFAEFMIVNYAEPIPEAQVTILNEWPDVFAREILDRVNVSNSLLTVSSAFYVRSVDHTIVFDGGLQHTLQMNCKLLPIKNWFTLSSPTLGRLNYNRLGF